MSFQLGPDRWVEREIDADGNELSSTPLENPDSATPGGSDVTEVDNEAPQVNVDWYPAAEYDSYLADRAQQKTEQVDVLGQQVALVTYGPTDHAFMLRPEGGLFLEVRSSQLSRAEFLSLMNDHAEKVSVRDWLAAMPAEMVTADNADGRLKKVLTGVPTPPGFKGADMGQETALDSYQFGAKVAGAVTCGWIQEWEQARTAGDTARATKAADALATSRDWQFLQDMDAEGDYPEVVWEIADQVTAGEQPEGYRGALGCS
ncbi:MAG: hypothetical protein EOO74_09915 [Myxococcales bacterium]|nr:MAG: hypothetical protein EOO74_09915 [Myxococcales bacterium]